MVNDRISQAGDQPAPTFTSTAEARGVVERFLCGEAVAGGLYRQALRYLEAEDPAALAALATRAGGIHAAEALRDDTLCDEILESLEAYASLGAAAGERMPGVHRHLEVCPSCRLDLDAARAALGWTAAEVGAGDPLSPESLIIGQDDRWVLVTKKRKKPIPLHQAPLTSGLFDPWKIELSQVIMTRGPESGEISETAVDEAAESLTLTTVLPGGRARIQLAVSMGGGGGSGQNPWRLSLSGTAFVDLGSLSVRLLNERGDVTKFETTLFPDRSPQVFDIVPDPGDRYQLIFGGVTPQDEGYSHRQVLPLAAWSHGIDRWTP